MVISPKDDKGKISLCGNIAVVNFFMALVATISMEMESFKGLLWYYWYRLRYHWYRLRYLRLGEETMVNVPPALGRLLPYVKFAVAAAGAVAAVVVAVMAHPPALVYVVISVASALGVYVVPNDTVKALLVDGHAAVDATESALEAAKTGNFPAVPGDLATALKAAEDGAGLVERVVQEVEHPEAPRPAAFS